jgi:hypothetical protein
MKKEYRMLVIIALTVTMMTGINNMYGKAFADPAHCDLSGWPSCYKVGYDDGHGMSGPCPSGHSSEFCRGWDDATSGSNNNGSPAEQNASNQQAPQQNVSTNVSLLRYENPNYGIEMQYPSGWDKDLNVTSPDIVTFYPRAVNSNASLTVTVDDISNEKGIPLAQYASDSNDAIKNRTHDFRLVESSTNNTLAGLPAYKSVYTYAGDNNSTVQGIEIGAIKGDKVYIFTYEAEPNEYYTYLPMIRNMIYSFQTTSQISPQPNATSETAKQLVGDTQLQEYAVVFPPLVNMHFGVYHNNTGSLFHGRPSAIKHNNTWSSRVIH